MIQHDRQTAQLLGLRTYTGSPCKAGHPGTRYTGNKACVECERENGAARKRKNADSERARKAAWRRDNRDKVNAAKKRQAANWTAEQRAARLAYDLAYTANDPNGKRAARKASDKAAAAARTAARKAARLALLSDPVYQAEQKEAARLRDRLRYRARTPEQRARDCERKREARARDPEKHAETNRMKQKTRRARLRGADVKATSYDALLILANQGGACAYCGATTDLHLDHKVAISQGGQHTFANLQWLCAWHNMSKHAQSDADYRRENGIPAATEWDCLI